MNFKGALKIPLINAFVKLSGLFPFPASIHLANICTGKKWRGVALSTSLSPSLYWYVLLLVISTVMV